MKVYIVSNSFQQNLETFPSGKNLYSCFKYFNDKILYSMIKQEVYMDKGKVHKILI